MQPRHSLQSVRICSNLRVSQRLMRLWHRISGSGSFSLLSFNGCIRDKRVAQRNKSQPRANPSWLPEARWTFKSANAPYAKICYLRNVPKSGSNQRKSYIPAQKQSRFSVPLSESRFGSGILESGRSRTSGRDYLRSSSFFVSTNEPATRR